MANIINPYRYVAAGGGDDGGDDFTENVYSGEFDKSSGDYMVSTDTDSVLNVGTGDFTWSVWLKTSHSDYDGDTSTTYGTYGGIVDLGGIAEPTSLSLAVISDSSGLTRAVWGYFNGGFSVNEAWSDDTWFHLALTRSGGTIKIYIDGTEELSQYDSNMVGHSHSVILSYRPFSVGRLSQSSSWDGFFNGNMDELAFFDSELSASDISDIYSSGGSGGTAACPSDLSSYSSLAAWYRFSDDNWAITEDSVGSLDLTNSGVTVDTDVPACLEPSIAISLLSPSVSYADGSTYTDVEDDWGEVTIDTEKTVVLKIENTGTADLTISSAIGSNILNSENLSLTLDSSTISAGGSTNADFDFTATDTDCRVRIIVYSDAPGTLATYIVDFNATAVVEEAEYVEIDPDSGNVYSGTGVNANYKFWTATDDTGFTVTNAGNSSGSKHIEFLLISGGGGGGGAYAGGGGGSGEFKEVTGSTHSAIEGDYYVYPGDGGAGAGYSSNTGVKGGNTTIDQGSHPYITTIYTAYGGGGGGSFSLSASQHVGMGGGSGGGGGVTNIAGAWNAPAAGGGSPHYSGGEGGYRISSTYRGAGGGGGAGGVGGIGSTFIGGAGGIGVSSTYWNQDAYTEWYAAGGGGWAHLSNPGGSGGSGIGGNGGTGSSSNSGGTAGMVSTGSGGGGDVTGYAGGSGLVVVRWKYQN